MVKSMSKNPRLSKPRIIGAAVCLADASGVAGVSMRSIARELGVEAMSLYHHVKDKHALLDGMVDTVFSEVEHPGSAEFREAMEVRALSLRSALLRHPWALALIDTRRAPEIATLTHQEWMLSALVRRGFSLTGAARQFFFIDSFIYGSVLQELQLSAAEQGSEPSAVELAEHVSAFPTLSAVVQAHLEGERFDYDDLFQSGLARILDSLEQQAPASSPKR